MIIFKKNKMNKLINFNNIRWACHHLHIDKSLVINRDNLEKSFIHMKDKWYIMRDIKKNYTEENLKYRMLETTSRIVNQGCNYMRTFIDVDFTVGLTPLMIAKEVQKYWYDKGVILQIGTQPLEGLETTLDIKLFERAAQYVDFIGCLPSRDKYPEDHLDVVFDTATNLNLDVEAHLDQCNIPTEFETELFCDYVEKYNYQGKARAVHSVSLSAQPINYQIKIAKRLNDLNIGVIVCPSAAISMTQHNDFYAPIHNSIAPVKLLIDENVDVCLGVDNIEDIFMPFCDGDLSFELRLLAEACRIYEPDILTSIANNKLGFMPK